MIIQIFRKCIQPLLPRKLNLTPKGCQTHDEFMAVLKNFAKLGTHGFERASVKSSEDGSVPFATTKLTWLGRVLEWFRPTQISFGQLETFFPAFIQKNEQHLHALPKQKILKNLKYLRNCFGKESKINRYVTDKINELSQKDKTNFYKAIPINTTKQKLIQRRDELEKKLSKQLEEINGEFSQEKEILDRKLRMKQINFDQHKKELSEIEEKLQQENKKLHAELDTLKQDEITSEKSLTEAFNIYSPLETHDMAIATEGYSENGHGVDPMQLITTRSSFFKETRWFFNSLRVTGKDGAQKVKISDGKYLPLFMLPFPKHIVMIAVQYFSGLPKIYKLRQEDFEHILGLADFINNDKFLEWIASQINELIVGNEIENALPWLIDDTRIPPKVYKHAQKIVAPIFSNLSAEKLKEISRICLLGIIPLLYKNETNLSKLKEWLQLQDPSIVDNDFEQLLRLASFSNNEEFLEWISSHINQKIISNNNVEKALLWLKDDTRIPPKVSQHSRKIIALNFSALSSENLKKISPIHLYIIIIQFQLDRNKRNLFKLKEWFQLQGPSFVEKVTLTKMLKEEIANFEAEINSSDESESIYVHSWSPSITYQVGTGGGDWPPRSPRRRLREFDRNLGEIDGIFGRDRPKNGMGGWPPSDGERGGWSPPNVSKYLEKCLLSLGVESKILRIKKDISFAVVPDSLVTRALNRDIETLILKADFSNATTVGDVLDELRLAKRESFSKSDREELKRKITKVKTCYARLLEDAHTLISQKIQILRMETNRIQYLETNFGAIISQQKARNDKELLEVKQRVSSELENLEQLRVKVDMEHKEKKFKLNDEHTSLESRITEFVETKQTFSLENSNFFQ